MSETIKDTCHQIQEQQIDPHIKRNLNQLSKQICQSTLNNFQKSSSSIRHSTLSNNQKIQPQPWSDMEMMSPHNPLLNNYCSLYNNELRSMNKKNSNERLFSKSKDKYLSKSFHIGQGVKGMSNNGRENVRTSQSNYRNQRNQQSKTRMSALSAYYLENQFDPQSNDQNRAFSLNYSNQQKARVSLDLLIHEKKNKKLTKFLKMKTACIDKNVFKKQIVSYKSRQLIDTLEKLSKDQVLKKSIDRAVDMLKKRTNSSNSKTVISGSGNITPTFNSNKSSDMKKLKLVSCQRTDTKYIQSYSQEKKSPTKKDNITNAQNIEKSFLHITHLNKQMIASNYPMSDKNQSKTQRRPNMMGERQRCKVAFKPKRNWLGDKAKHIQKLQQNSIKLHHYVQDQFFLTSKSIICQNQNSSQHVNSPNYYEKEPQ